MARIGLNPPADEVVSEEVAPAEVAPRLEQVATELGELRAAVDTLRELAEPLTQPAQLTTVELSAATPARMLDERGIRTASITVLNPTEAVILLGIGGGRASSQARAITVPPQSLITLPVAAGDVEIGTEAELESDTVVVHLFRYRTVQPAFLGAR